jgi:uncharacterized protein YcnI
MNKETTVKSMLVAALAALIVPSVAFAHAKVSPPVGLKGESQVYTLAVPTEKEDAETTRVELTPPSGFSIDSFLPSPGWKRDVQQSGSGEDAIVTKVTWSGGSVPTGEDAAFSFLGQPSSARSYTFGVRQTYSDGSVVDWNGPESSDTPSPTLDVKSSFGGGGGSSTLAVIALIVGAIGALLGAAALLGGRRALA